MTLAAEAECISSKYTAFSSRALADTRAIIGSMVDRVTRRPASVGGLPYPVPGSLATIAVMKANRRVDTSPELRLRSALHRAGLRFRKDHPIPTDARTVRPDIVFTAARLAVFIDGCFWHQCPDHGHMPKSNQGYWLPKLQANRERDARTDRALRDAGWAVLRVWEHVPADEAAGRVSFALRTT
jgi:DNA mismatch endonuclease Vsr